MKLPKLIAGILPRYFLGKALGDAPNQPDYFLKPEHFEAIDKIISARRVSIKKQGQSFDDLTGDVTILEANVFGDVSDIGDDDIAGTKKQALEALKTAPEKDQRAFLQTIYNTFNHGRFDEKPAFEKWVSGANSRFAAIMGEVRAAQELLSQHSVSLMTSHSLKEPSSIRSMHTKDVIEVAGMTNGFVVAMSNTRNELDKGFGRLFKIKTDAARVAAVNGGEFPQAFEEYVDGLEARLGAIHGSKATPEDHLKWEDRLSAAETLIAKIQSRQLDISSPDKTLADDASIRAPQ